MSLNSIPLSNSNPYRVEAYNGNERVYRYQRRDRYSTRLALAKRDIVEANEICSSEGNAYPLLVYFQWLDDQDRSRELAKSMKQADQSVCRKLAASSQEKANYSEIFQSVLSTRK